MDKNNNGFSMIKALVMGTLIGGALGVLFAPSEGTKTRKLLKKKAKDAFEDAQENIEDTATDVKFKAENLKGDITNKATDIKENIADKLEEVKGKLDEDIGVDNIDVTVEERPKRGRRQLAL